MDRKNDDDVLSVWINEIFPLVEEYFFGDRTKLKDILHDDDVYIQNKSCFTKDKSVVEKWINESTG